MKYKYDIYCTDCGTTIKIKVDAKPATTLKARGIAEAKKRCNCKEQTQSVLV